MIEKIKDNKFWWAHVVAALAFVYLVGCSGEDVDEVPDVGAERDVSTEDVAAESDVADTGEGPTLLPVELDFDEHFDGPGQGFVRGVQVESDEDLIDGEVAQGMLGDWLLENDHGRYLIGFGERVVGPCSWDGNPIELEAVDGGKATGSVLGEICLLLNVGQTFRPELVELVEDGKEGRAIIAVTGRPVPLDFLNVSSMVADFAPGLLDIVDFDPERELPVTITVYYVLTPESRSLRVLTAIRNDGEEQEYVVAAHLILSGSTGSYFTPLGGRKGWGYRSLGADNLNADPVSFVGYFSRHAGYALVPDPAEHMQARLPVGGGMLAVSGVVAVIHGATDVLQLLTSSEDRWATTDGYLGMEPDGVATVGYRLYPSDGSVSSVSDSIFADLEVETTTISGRIVDHEGNAIGGAKVTALEGGDRSFTMSWTGEDGLFSMDVPDGQWELRVRAGGMLTPVTDIQAAGTALELGDIGVAQPATVQVEVRTANGEPTPARIVIACQGGCGERREDSREMDQIFGAPNGWLRIVEVGIDGDETLFLAPGEYRLSVNRGMTWTTWPQDATQTGGMALSLESGDAVTLEAEIAEVVDTSNTLSADFHIHAMASPDSSVADEQRVLDFLAGGLDVMVSSDHDGVVDFQPAIDALGAGAHITSVVGSEITASNLGHINVFPLERDETARRGGPLDWSRAGGYHLTLQEVIDATRQHPGEQVVQLNHPRLPLGAIGLLEADVLTGQSFAEREKLRMPDGDVDEVTGDTGLWTDDFDAIEVLNGFSMNNFWSSFRWWLIMVGRGFSPTATAVSDTHGIYGSLGASPRSFAFVDDGFDRPATMNLEHFVDRIRSGALIGTNGPFMRVEIRNINGAAAGLGDVLDASHGEVTAYITLEMPEWIDVDSLDVYINVGGEELQGAPGEAVSDPLEPTLRLPVVWDAQEHRELVASGEYDHYRLRQIVEVPLEVEADSYVVFVARGLSAGSMRPVIASSARPLAFSNPVYLDFDGGGYDNPPLAQLRQERLSQGGQAAMSQRRSSQVIIAPGEEITAENLGRLFEAMGCNHDDDNEEVAGSHGHHHHGPHGHVH